MCEVLILTTFSLGSLVWGGDPGGVVLGMDGGASYRHFWRCLMSIAVLFRWS